MCLHVCVCGEGVGGHDESSGVQVGSLPYAAHCPAVIGSVIKQRSTFAGLCLAIQSACISRDGGS